MSLDWIKFAFVVMQWLTTCSVAVYAWYSSRQSARAAAVAELDRRVLVIEEQMRHLPDQDLVNQLHGDMKAVKAELVGIKEAQVAMARSLDRINDYLLNQK